MNDCGRSVLGVFNSNGQLQGNLQRIDSLEKRQSTTFSNIPDNVKVETICAREFGSPVRLCDFSKEHGSGKFVGADDPKCRSLMNL